MTGPILYNVQLLRFMAAFAILFTHGADLLFHGSRFVTAIPWTAGVDVFFVVSGFIMTWMTAGEFGKSPAARRFLLRRIVRVVPPYWLFTILLVIAVTVAGGRLRNTTADPTQVFTSLFFIPWPRIDGQLNPILAQGWTLNFEMFFYAAFALSMLFRHGLPALAGGFIMLVALHPIVPEHWFVLAFYTDPIILEFLAGIAIARLYLGGVRLGRLAAMVLVAVAVIVYLLMPPIDGAFARVCELGIPAAIFTAALILAPEPDTTGPILKAARVSGDASYALYLSHTLIAFPVVLLAQQAGIDAPWLILATILVVAVSFSILFYRWVEAPVTTLLGRKLQLRAPRCAASVAG